MTRKKKALIVLAILAVILLAFLGGQAYAKYVSQVKGQGIAEVATWDFKVNGQSEQVEEIKLASTYDNQTLVDNKIAPGTSGSFNIIVDASGSEVGINYNIDFTEEENKPQNLKFIYEDREYNSIEDLENNLSGVINADDEEKTKTLNIQWKWDYETGKTEEEISQNDIVYTKDSQNVENYTFKVAVTGTQVQPQ